MTAWPESTVCCPFGDCPTCNPEPVPIETIRQIRQQATTRKDH